MNQKEKLACGIRHYQGMAKEFTPITVSANFAALESPQGLNSGAEAYQAIRSAEVARFTGSKSGQVPTGLPKPVTNGKKEDAMKNDNSIVECGICYFQGTAREFTPITASADLDALECPKCLNNDADSFCEIKKSQEVKAA